MQEAETQPLWLALPCIVLSLFTTCLLTPAISSQGEGGLSTVVKAAMLFLVTLVLATAGMKYLLQSQSETFPETTLGEPSHGPYERVQVWRESQWTSSSSSEGEKRRKERAWGEEKPRKKRSKDERDRKEDRSVRKLLKKKFGPKRKDLLGERRETVVQVMGEQ